MTVSEGKPSETKVINKYCGQETPPTIRASGRYLKVKFDSDHKRSKKGFAANYVAFKVGKEDIDLTTLAPPDIYGSSESPTDEKSDTSKIPNYKGYWFGVKIKAFFVLLNFSKWST